MIETDVLLQFSTFDTGNSLNSPVSGVAEALNLSVYRIIVIVLVACVVYSRLASA